MENNMKQILSEELKRIHEITYGKKIIEEQEFLNNILKWFFPKKDDPKKSDLVSSNVDDFFNTLETASNQGGITQQDKGSNTFQKEVESLQIGLSLLGYELPKNGIDGVFGSETSEMVKKFMEKTFGNKFDSSNADEATPEMLDKMIQLLKQKNITSEDLKELIDKRITSGASTVSLSGDWINISKDLIKKWESFTDKASWDENKYRGGYGSGKKLENGRLVDVTKNTTWTQAEAENTLEHELKNFYGPTIANQLGMDNWNKLNDKQKASLVSLGYNAGPYFVSAREYGKKIKNAIENDDMELAAAHIQGGPTTGAVSGKFYSGLQRRRNEEAQIFLA
jgi:GH24 family phage-related lysozyme (muramidase)